MRMGLAPLVGRRMMFRSKIARFSHTTRFRDNTIMLENICIAETGEQVAEHVWFRNVAWADKSKLKIGQTIEFKADVVTYKKRTGNKDDRRNKIDDLKLANAAMVCVV